MTDPREIEGSPERAADRGRAEDLGFSMDPRPSLGNVDVVRGLVSEFGSAIVGVRKDYHEDKLTGEQAQERVRELAREYGDIILGRSEKYFALPWNDPSRLGRRIKLVVPAAEGVSDPGELLFVTIGTSLMAIGKAHEEERLSDADAERHTKDMLEDTASLILGHR
ncbi:hypothetical protein FHR70_000720 [Microvirga lupini]|uniref:Uncharacterized protein n=1 Tax=Microvirga lupini TaxID=420324 RepID=A0A7W4VI70_9HYPH|nr:hypothetical protein [Microvirga lupini]MBB3017680.1 hypothetical protein [Microvirga lupini]